MYRSLALTYNIDKDDLDLLVLQPCFLGLGLQMCTSIPALWYAGNQIQGRVHVGQALYQPTYISNPSNPGVPFMSVSVATVFCFTAAWRQNSRELIVCFHERLVHVSAYMAL